MKKVSLLLFSLLNLFNIYAQEIETELVLVSGGSFKMGNSESIYYDEYPDHSVTVNDFYLGKYEVTIEQYMRFSKNSGVFTPEGEPKLPATGISWEEAIMYCNWLSRLEHLDKCYTIIRDDKNNTTRVEFNKTTNGYRLPTEAEWEFAAKDGVLLSIYSYSGSNNATEIAWFMGTGKTLQPVGEKKPNQLGIFDMSGNAQEWCFDVYLPDFYKKSPSNNPICENGANERVSRGGNYDGHEETLRITKRFYNAPNYRDMTIGFRVAKNK